MAAGHSDPTRVLVVCPGLDRVRRGFEVFARECFETLRDDPALDIALIKGSGPAARAERSIPTLRRDSLLARALARIWGRESFRVEQLAFGASLLPVLARRRPDVVYFSEWHTGLVMGAYRRLSRQRLRLVLCNGTMAVEGFGHLDRVQQLTPAAREAALERGDIPSRHVLLPLGFAMSRELRVISDADRSALRLRLGLPADRPVVLSVAALNRYHKRLDYLIEEVAALPAPRPFLLLAGEQEQETQAIRALAADRLGDDGHDIRTVPHSEVADLYRASDAFVLASLGEGLPRALIEALGAGLPCLVHDYPVAHYALGPHGNFSDFSVPGGIAGMLGPVLDRDPDPEQAKARHDYAYERFSWDSLRPRYVRLLQGRSIEAWSQSAAQPMAEPCPHRSFIH